MSAVCLVRGYHLQPGGCPSDGVFEGLKADTFYKILAHDVTVP